MRQEPSGLHAKWARAGTRGHYDFLRDQVGILARKPSPSYGLSVAQAGRTRQGERDVKAADIVVEWVRSRVARGELVAGDRLPAEHVLIEQFGVSKPTLREALRVLEGDNLITIIRGRNGGVEIRAPGSDRLAHDFGLLLQSRGTSLGELYDLRLMLEARAPQLLGTRTDLPAVLDRLQALAEIDVNKSNRSRAVKVGHQFHTELIRLTRNRALIVFTEVLEKTTEAASLSLLKSVPRERPRVTVLSHALADHLKLVKLLRRGSIHEAQELWYQHLVDARNGMMNKELSHFPAAIYDLNP